MRMGEWGKECGGRKAGDRSDESREQRGLARDGEGWFGVGVGETGRNRAWWREAGGEGRKAV